MRRFEWTVAIVAVLGIASTGWAQLTWLDDPTTSVSVDPGATIIAPITAVATSGGMTVTGDLTLFAHPEFQQMYVWESVRPFQVGPLPIEVSAVYAQSFKIAVSGGDESDPSANLIIAFMVDEQYPYTASVDALGAYTDTTQAGNGWYIGGAPMPTGDYVLTPGMSYDLTAHFQLDLDPQPQGTPTAAATFEFGGVTSFSGIDLDLTWQTVPEPASLALLAMGGMVLVRKRG